MVSAMSRIDLLPCPFCGGEADTLNGSSYQYGTDAWVCFCTSCDAQGPVKGTERKAVEAWNARVIDRYALLAAARLIDEIAACLRNRTLYNGSDLARGCDVWSCQLNIETDRIRKGVGEKPIWRYEEL